MPEAGDDRSDRTHKSMKYMFSCHFTICMSISSQAVAVLMEETLALGADDWMGSNADGTGAPGGDGPRVHLDVPRPKEK